MTEMADAVIVGGGVIGASIAYHLAKQEFGHIVLLERDALAQGSTGRSVATIDLLTLQVAAAELFARSAAFFQEFDEIFGSGCGYERTGSITLAGPDQEDELLAAVGHMQAAGAEVNTITMDALTLLEPMADLSGVSGASYAAQGGYADPVLTTQAFAGAARRLGVTIHQGRAVTGFRQQGNQISGVETEHGIIESPLVIIAAGAWSIELLRNLKIHIDLQPVLHPVVCVRRTADFGPAHHSLLDLTTGIYARPERGGLTLLGSINPQVGHDPTDPDLWEGYISDDYVLWTMERLVSRYPALAQSTLCKGWCGVMTISPDWQPVIGQWPDRPGLFCATGFSGRGFQISPATGDLLARLICGDKKAGELLAPFTPTRLDGSRLLRTGERNKDYGLLG
jgi:sarcosine oxidase subunit beta